MHYIVFSIDPHMGEYLFLLEYASADSLYALSELVKINTLCYMKGFDFDFFELGVDPNYFLQQEGVYLYKFVDVGDVLNRLDIDFTTSEREFFDMKNQEITNILTTKKKDQILAIIHQNTENYEIFKMLFETKDK